MDMRRFRVFLVALFTIVALAASAVTASGKGLAQCSDGIDNDGDGLIDLGNDPGCTSPSDNTEANAQPQCSDGIDNDADGLTDFPADSGCFSAEDNLETYPTQTQCSDGIDNDRDGLVDFPNDPGCFSGNDNTEKTH